MNLALVHLWKEWRAQRGVLLAYCLLVYGCLALGLWLAPVHAWADRGLGVHALVWFTAAGAIGVVGFAAPALVRGEFGAKDDQFVRRLPGALGPAFAGKLLFLLLATALLPLLSLWLGELYVTARGHDWAALWSWRWDGEVVLEWSWTAAAAVGALLFGPWLFAVGSWLPGGRMALGATALLGLLLGVAVFAVLRQSPGLLGGFAWWRWLWVLPPSGALVAYVGFAKGRRGGGALRSARLGLAATGCLLLPPGLWLGAQAFDYHHPDLQRLVLQEVRGLAPDHRRALVYGAAARGYEPVPVWVDLATGAATQFGGIHRQFTSEIDPDRRLLNYRGVQQHWLGTDPDGLTWHLDLVRGAVAAIGRATAAGEPPLPPALATAVAAQTAATAPFRAPDGRPVWPAHGALCYGAADGAVERVPLPVAGSYQLMPAGHAVRIYGERRQLFDLGTRTVHARRGASEVVVRGVALWQAEPPSRQRGWQRQAPGAPAAPCGVLNKAEVLGLWDDDHLLVWRRVAPASGELFFYRPVDDTTVPLAAAVPLAAKHVDVAYPLVLGALLPRDPAGRLWLRLRTGSEEQFAVLDVATGSVRTLLPFTHRGDASRQLLGWPDAEHVLLREDDRIVRVRLADQRRDVLFPRR